MRNPLRVIEPTYAVRNFEDIDFDKLRARHPGLRLGLVDVDRTVTGHHDLTIPEPKLAAMERAERAGLVLAFLSNAGSQGRSDRVFELTNTINTHPDYNINMAAPTTSHNVTGPYKRKPARSPYYQTLRRLGFTPDQAVMIGDQGPKDIMGAKLAGLAVSIQVAPCGEGGDWLVNKVQKPLEAVARVTIGMPFHEMDFANYSPEICLDVTVVTAEADRLRPIAF